MDKKIIISISAIVIILAIAFFSQKSYFEKSGETLISGATDQASAYLAKGSDWVMSNVFSKITGEVQKRGDLIQTELTKEKEKISENVGEKIGNYFSGITNSILHPGTANSCGTQPTSN